MTGSPNVYTLVYQGDDLPRRKYSFWIDDDQLTGLKTVKERDGVLESEQIRRAIKRWLEGKQIPPKSSHTAKPPRRRS